MCGICGVKLSGAVPREDAEAGVRAMVARMTRRGPDDEGVWSNGAGVVLGFRRLSVLDTSSAGHQPMVSRDDRHVIAFNGEIYNFRELREELIALGHTFTSSGDTEVLLAALREWGSAAVPRLNGMFAFAWFNGDTGALMLGRDRFGIKPLFVAETAEGVIFGSQFDQVITHPALHGARVSPHGLAAFLRHGATPPPLGLFEEIAQVPPGMCITYRSGMPAVRTRYRWPVDRWSGPRLSGDALVEALDAAVGDAVRRQLVSDVPVGVFLSGGIDSPLVAAHAAAQTGRRLQGFCIASDEPSMDESEAAQRYADDFGVELHIDHMSEAELLAALPDVLASSTHPIADFSIFPTLLVSRLARRHVTVALSGDGGDELFFGYPSRYGAVLESAPYFRLPRAMRVLAGGAARHVGRQVSRVDMQSASLGALLERKQSIWSRNVYERFLPGLAAASGALPRYESAPRDRDSAAYWARECDLDVHLPMVLDKVDRASMYHSLEVRVPLLDDAVVDIAARAEWSSCIDLRTRVAKLPLRGALRRHTALGTSGKKGFTAPMHRWLDGPLRTLLHDTLGQRTSLLGLPFSHSVLPSVLQEMRDGRSAYATGIWALLSLALWEDRHLAPHAGSAVGAAS